MPSKLDFLSYVIIQGKRDASLRSFLTLKRSSLEGTLWSVNNLENLHFDNVHDIHTSFKNCEESGYKHYLDLVNQLFQLMHVVLIHDTHIVLSSLKI